MLKKIFKAYSEKFHGPRRKLFLDVLKPGSEDKIIDLGGEDGERIARIVTGLQVHSVTIADISATHFEDIKSKYNYSTVLISESDNLPFKDKEFDIVFCNSVIEHVTALKSNIWGIKDDKEFKEISIRRQKKFADEIRRIGKGYFVQTPNKYFIIESHTWLPGVMAILPRPVFLKTLRFFNLFWPKRADPDFNLLTYKEMQELFPDADIYREKSLGFTKSLIAIKNNNSTGRLQNYSI